MKTEPDGRAVAVADVATVRAGQLPRDEQPEPGPARLPGGVGVAAEPLEEPALGLRRDTRPLVGDLDLDPCSPTAARDDAGRAAAVLVGVAQQVRETSGRGGPGCTSATGGRRRALDDGLPAAPGARRGRGLSCGSRSGRTRDARTRAPRSLLTSARMSWGRRRSARRCARRCSRLRCAVLTSPSVIASTPDLAVAHDRGQRVADLVAEHAHQVDLELVRLLELAFFSASCAAASARSRIGSCSTARCTSA